MNCEHFEICGGCQVKEDYITQLQQKSQKFKELFGFFPDEVFSSPETGFRARAEFRLHREKLPNGEFGGKISLSMNTFGKNERIAIQNCPNLLPNVQKVIAELPLYLKEEILSHKLYAVNFLGGEEVIMTMIYHKNLDSLWQDQAKKLAQILKISIIGRSKNQKIIIGTDLLPTKINIHQKELFYLHQEGSFSQPNPFINGKMLNFVIQAILPHHKKDLLEMYCGSGNFTIALAPYFDKVFATEVVKSALPLLEINAKNNGVKNLYSARLSGMESIEALSFKRDFFRLKHIDLKQFNFSHILIDPPRSGIGDVKMLEFIQKFSVIVYISCNPFSLKKDLEVLLQSHRITKSAIFDQFPYTYHMECALILEKRF